MKNDLAISRRRVMKTFGGIVVAVPAGSFLGGGILQASELVDSAGVDQEVWAIGGTDLITEDFPDDSIFDLGESCQVSLTKADHLGPCYFSVEDREDLSTGLLGLPMMLCLKVVDSSCNPVEGLRVEVWHCDNNGVYSGDTSNSDEFNRFRGDRCTGGEEQAKQSTWYRGQLTSDANGRVNFKTCFPGWYAGRTIHIHFRIRQEDRESLVSQLCFSDEFCEEICTTHPLYMARGIQDTPISSGKDLVFDKVYESLLLNTKKNGDNTLLGYKTIQIQ